MRKIVSQPGRIAGPRWSPDGKQIVFSSAMGREAVLCHQHASGDRAAEGGTPKSIPKSITDSFDENAGLLEWKQDGIYFNAQQKTASHLFRVDPATGKMVRITQPDDLMAGSVSLSRDGQKLAFTASSPTTLSEVFVTDTQKFAPRKLTNMTEQTKNLTLGTRELVRWKSQDGTDIEGVLIKPADFDPHEEVSVALHHSWRTNRSRSAVHC